MQWTDFFQNPLPQRGGLFWTVDRESLAATFTTAPALTPKGRAQNTTPAQRIVWPFIPLRSLLTRG
jgi:hypothetical protein